jgi:hypothetical protein
MPSLRGFRERADRWSCEIEELMLIQRFFLQKPACSPLEDFATVLKKLHGPLESTVHNRPHLIVDRVPCLLAEVALPRRQRKVGAL